MTRPNTPPTRQQAEAIRAAKLLMTPARPAIRSISRPSKAVRNILRPMGKKFGPGVRALKMRWAEIAGARLAAVCTPTKLSGGKDGQILTIQTRGSAAMLVQAQSTQLLERINLVSGSTRVKRLRIVQGPMALQGTKPKETTQKFSVSPAQLSALDEQLKHITSPELKAALRELGLGVLSKNQQS